MIHSAIHSSTFSVKKSFFFFFCPHPLLQPPLWEGRGVAPPLQGVSVPMGLALSPPLYRPGRTYPERGELLPQYGVMQGFTTPAQRLTFYGGFPQPSEEGVSTFTSVNASQTLPPQAGFEPTTFRSGDRRSTTEPLLHRLATTFNNHRFLEISTPCRFHPQPLFL